MAWIDQDVYYFSAAMVLAWMSGYFVGWAVPTPPDLIDWWHKVRRR